jgi:hypothetical protein
MVEQGPSHDDNIAFSDQWIVVDKVTTFFRTWAALRC